MPALGTEWFLVHALAQAPDRLAVDEQPLTATTPADRPRPPARFVVANTYGLNFGFTSIPSGEVSLFLGASLPVRLWHPAHWIALGYQGTFSAGFADVPTMPHGFSLFVHRHHVALHGVAGRKGRLAYGAGVGAAFPIEGPSVGLEGEGRLGYVFARPGARVQGIFGGQMRLSGSIGWLAWPQFGVFVGFTRAPLPFAPGAARGSLPRGLGLLISGAALLGGGVLAVSVTAAMIHTTDFQARRGLAWVVGGTAIGIGIPLVIVGGVRHAAWQRRHAARVRLGSGLAIDF